jgi:predicted nucleic acid-binding protein
MKAYLDSSVILRILLEQPHPLEEFQKYEERIGSELLEVECLRTLDRMRLTGELTEEQNIEFRSALFQSLQSMNLLSLSPAILRRASGPFPVVLGTLDAIHLSTAIAWKDAMGDDLVIATHDKSLGKAAMALGFKIEGV